MCKISWTMSESFVVRLLYYMMAYQTMELMEGSDTVHIRNRLITMRDRERLGEGVMSIVIHNYEAAPTCSPISVTIVYWSIKSWGLTWHQ